MKPPRLLYLVEWRERGAWEYRTFTNEAAALRMSLRLADRGHRPIMLQVTPNDLRMIREQRRRERAA